MPTRSGGTPTSGAAPWTPEYWQQLLQRPQTGSVALRSPEALQQTPQYQYATTGQVPKGYHIGPNGYPTPEPGFGDWMYKNLPMLLAAAGTAGMATTPALAGASFGAKAGANAALQSGLSAASGGSLKDVALAGAGGVAGAGGAGMSSWTDLLKDPNTWASIAQVAGKAAGGKSDQRMQETQATNSSNLADLALYSAGQNAQNQAGQLDLNRKGFTEQARSGRAKQALLADLISNIKDVNINVPGVQAANITGGLRPSAIGDTGRQSMAELAKQALQAQLSGDTFTGGEILPTPQYKAMPERGGVETALDWIGLLGAGAGALGGVLNKTQQPTKYSTLPDVYRGLE